MYKAIGHNLKSQSKEQLNAITTYTWQVLTRVWQGNQSHCLSCPPLTPLTVRTRSPPRTPPDGVLASDPIHLADPNLQLWNIFGQRLNMLVGLGEGIHEELAGGRSARVRVPLLAWLSLVSVLLVSFFQP